MTTPLQTVPAKLLADIAAAQRAEVDALKGADSSRSGAANLDRMRQAVAARYEMARLYGKLADIVDEPFATIVRQASDGVESIADEVQENIEEEEDYEPRW